jgi:hypothetical protein
LTGFDSDVCDWVVDVDMDADDDDDDDVDADAEVLVADKALADPESDRSAGSADAPAGREGRHSISSILMQIGSDFVGSMSRVWIEIVGWGRAEGLTEEIMMQRCWCWSILGSRKLREMGPVDI